MRKLVVVALALMLAGSAVALDVEIHPEEPGPIVLGEDGDYEVEMDFYAVSDNDITSYGWNLLDTQQSDSGPVGTFTFDNEGPQVYTVRLMVSDGTESALTEFTQGLHDIPRIDDTTIEVDTSDGSEELTFDADDYVENIYDGPVEDYSWELDGEDVSESESGESFEYEFESGDEGEYTLELEATDRAGYTGTGEFKVDVANATSGDDDEFEDELPPGLFDDEDEDEGPEFDEIMDVFATSFDAEVLSFSESPVTGMVIETSDLLEGELKSRATDRRPSEAGTTPEGEVYRYMHYETDFDGDVDGVDFEFQVDESWIEDNDISPATVDLQRYNNGWQELGAELVDQDQSNYYYEAFSTGFSVFSITGESWDDLFQVTELSVSDTEVMAGETVEIEVVLENTAPENGSYELDVHVSGEVMTEEVTIPAGENETLTFETVLEDTGTATIDVGSQSTDVEVQGEGLPWLMIGGLLFIVVLTGVGFLFLPEIQSALKSAVALARPDIDGAHPTMSGRLDIGEVVGKMTPDRDTRKKYSFEGFGEDKGY